MRIEPLGMGDVASAVELVRHVLRVDPGDRGEQFASDITDDSRQMFVAKANGQVIAYGRVAELAADEAAPGTSAGYYLSGVLGCSGLAGPRSPRPNNRPRPAPPAPIACRAMQPSAAGPGPITRSTLHDKAGVLDT